MAVAGENARLPTVEQYLAAIAIMFDFVNPVLAFGRLIDRRSKLRLDKAKPINDAEHALVLAGGYERDQGGGFQGDGDHDYGDYWENGDKGHTVVD